MKQYRNLLFIIAFFLIEGMLGLWFMKKPMQMDMDIVKVNDMTQTYLKEGIAGLKNMDAEQMAFGIYDETGSLLYRNDDRLADTLAETILHQDTAIDIIQQEQHIGNLVVYNTMIEDMARYRERMFILLSLAMILQLIFMIIYFYYLRRTYIYPFAQLQEFAARVAGGDLDFPLAMDRHHAFGAFSESFDIMREELKKAKLQELAANQSKKELVAKLSHDIKTPVASIQAVSELMAVQASSKVEQQKLSIIQAKATQIDGLISDLFHATLEELQELPVQSQPQDSRCIKQLLERADYQHRAQLPDIPQCLLWYDEQRLQQVFDNLFVNAYKYAEGDMIVQCRFEQTYLLIMIQDHGCSLQEEELPRLFDKYYRGKNSEKKSGAGLGLYISRYLIEQMGGYMEAYQNQEGFCMHVALALV